VIEGCGSRIADRRCRNAVILSEGLRPQSKDPVERLVTHPQLTLSHFTREVMVSHQKFHGAFDSAYALLRMTS
jgi:hypothetical protein